MEANNMIAMRDALKQIHDRVNSLDEDCGVDPVEIRDIARAALAKPPRNCDVLSDAQEALTAIHEDRCYVNNPIDERRLTVEWLFDEAKGETK